MFKNLDTLIKVFVNDINRFSSISKTPDIVDLIVHPTHGTSSYNPIVDLTLPLPLKAYEKTLDQKDFLKTRVIIAFDPNNYIRLSSGEIIDYSIKNEIKGLLIQIQQYKWMLKHKVPYMPNPERGAELFESGIKKNEELIENNTDRFIRSTISDIVFKYDELFIEEYPGEEYIRTYGFRNISSLTNKEDYIINYLRYHSFINELKVMCSILEKPLYIIPKEISEEAFFTCPYCGTTMNNNIFVAENGTWHCSNCDRDISTEYCLMGRLIDYAMKYMNPDTIKDHTKFIL